MSDPAQDLNCRVAGCEPHRIHLVEATAELLAECHRAKRYLTLCGELLTTKEPQSSDCELDGCERPIIFCTKCVDLAAKHNAEEAGLTPDSPASGAGR